METKETGLITGVEVDREEIERGEATCVGSDSDGCGVVEAKR